MEIIFLIINMLKSIRNMQKSFKRCNFWVKMCRKRIESWSERRLYTDAPFAGHTKSYNNYKWWACYTGKFDSGASLCTV